MALAEIALERLSRVAPKLAKKVISFYDMTEELPEDTGLNVGVFILKVGQSQYYIPVVAKGGTVFPIDSIYSQEDSTFIPITRSGIDKVLASGQKQMGTPSTIPGTVIKNPGLREMVEPPRTGKYVYAGTLLPEAMAQMSETGKEWFLSKIASEEDLMKHIHNLGINVTEMKEALQKEAMVNDHEELETHSPVRVVSEPEEGLEDGVIQEILQNGYGIIGEHQYPRIAVEYTAATEGFTYLPAACENNAYEVCFRNGPNKIGFIPEFIRCTGLGEADKRGSGDKSTLGTNYIVFEDGSYSTSNNVVIRQIPRDFVGALKSLMDKGSFKNVEDVEMDDTIMVITPKGFSCPATVRGVVRSESGTCITTYSGEDEGITEILVSDNVHGGSVVDGRTLYVSPECKALIVKGSCHCDVERDLNKAVTRYEYSEANLVKEAHVVDFDGVEFHVDSRPVGGISKVASVLAVDYGIAPETTRYFIKKAQEDGRLKIQLSKQAEINGVGPDDNSTTTAADLYKPHSKVTIPEYGNPITPEPAGPMAAVSARKDISGSKNKAKRAPTLSAQLVKQAAVTNDKQIVEASIMSELLKDPALEETISSYMPSIDEALDKIGRTLLLLRINNDAMLEKISPEEYSSLVSALRNTYKLLGENKLTLEQLVTDGGAGQ